MKGKQGEPGTLFSWKPSAFFDMVRNLAMLSVVLYHAIAAYSTVTPYWLAHDGNSIIADFIRQIFDVFMMPVFFFAVGYFALPSLERKGVWQFLKGKFRRVEVPRLLTRQVGWPFTLAALSSSLAWRGRADV